MSNTIRELQYEVAEVNEANGWRDTAERDDVNWQITQVALIITEAAEAIEELRNGKPAHETYYAVSENPSNWLRKPEGVPSELADVVIRALDCADLFGIDLQAIIREKIEYNRTRGYRHGGKVA